MPEEGPYSKRGMIRAAATPVKTANRITEVHAPSSMRRATATKIMAANPSAVAAKTLPGAKAFIADRQIASPIAPSEPESSEARYESSEFRRVRYRSIAMMMTATFIGVPSAAIATKFTEVAGIMPANDFSRLSNISSDMNVVTVAKTNKVVSALRRSLPTMTVATVKDKIVK